MSYNALLTLDAKIDECIAQIARETRPAVLERRRIGLLRLLWQRAVAEQETPS